MMVNINPAASQQNKKKLPVSNYFSFIAGVVETSDESLLSKISANIRKNSKWPQWDTQGTGGN
jgi:hypothetical protein